MTIKVKHPGMQATIQDLGRIGVQKYGIVVSGAMDHMSLRIGNILVDNEEDEAGIEVMFYGTSIECTADQLIAITGGDLQPEVDGNHVPMWRPIYVKKGSTLSFKGAKAGLFAYVSIAGGIDVPVEIGSKSTFSKAGIGGYNGRALQAEDELAVGSIGKTQEQLMNALQKFQKHPSWYVNTRPLFTRTKETKIRVLKASEYDRFTKASQTAFTTSPYTLTPHVDRMGFTFTGDVLQVSTREEMLSEAVTYGTIQVPASGKPIILMAERQTTGGYPKIAQVITADLPRLAQLQPTSQVTFEIVSVEEAEAALFQRELFIEELKRGMYVKRTTGGMNH